jgi:hypothetical protein
MGTVYTGEGTVFELPTRGLPVSNPKNRDEMSAVEGNNEPMQVSVYLFYSSCELLTNVHELKGK